MENQTITLELKDETGRVCGGFLAIGRAISHLAPRGTPNPDTLFYAYRNGERVSAVLRLIPAHYWIVFDGNARNARALMRSWGDEFPDPIVGEPFFGRGGWLAPVVDGEPVRYGSSLGSALDKECAFLVRVRRDRIDRVA
ncbi:MAG: hypothetical protein WCD12_11435 [Candidatus Binatus sp.]|uniref:hypothetical protein n=1 Tax=Candidatus Binatus sp. TaxID=2811406 RepID=UPI003C791331